MYKRQRETLTIAALALSPTQIARRLSRSKAIRASPRVATLAVLARTYWKRKRAVGSSLGRPVLRPKDRCRCCTDSATRAQVPRPAQRETDAGLLRPTTPKHCRHSARCGVPPVGSDEGRRTRPISARLAPLRSLARALHLAQRQDCNRPPPPPPVISDSSQHESPQPTTPTEHSSTERRIYPRSSSQSLQVPYPRTVLVRPASPPR